ncbi:unnamed protein product [Acidithrix sp. C25]|nr:unnamed protein product [Acidithrix sp. C25]
MRIAQQNVIYFDLEARLRSKDKDIDGNRPYRLLTIGY